MPYLQQSRPHPNNPLGAALQSIGGSISDYSAQRRAEEKQAEALRLADEKSQGALSYGMQALKGDPGGITPPSARGVYQTGNEKGKIDIQQIGEARLRIARNAPQMLSWFDQQTAATLKEEKRKLAFPKIEQRILEGQVQGWIPEGQGETFAQTFAEGGDPSVIMASLDQMQGDFVKQAARKMEAEQEGQMDMMLMQSEVAKNYSDPKTEKKTGVIGYMGAVHAITKDLEPGQRLAFKAALGGAGGGILLEVLQQQKTVSEQWKARAMQGMKAKMARLAVEDFEAGRMAEGIQKMDEHALDDKDIAKAGGPVLQPTEEDAFIQARKPGAKQQPTQGGEQAVWKGSKSWKAMEPDAKAGIVKELMLMLEQKAGEKKIRAYIDSQDIEVTDDELAEAIASYQARWKGMVPEGQDPNTVWLTPEANNLVSGSGW